METADRLRIAERELKKILAAANRQGINVTGTASDGRITVRGVTALIINVLGTDAFGIREDQGNHPGGVQIRVTVQPPRWGDSDPPSTLDQMRAIADEWLRSELKLSRLPAA